MYKGEKVKIMGVGVIVEKDGKILMIQEKQEMEIIGKVSNMVSYPLETVKANESPLEAAISGYKEEVGLGVKLNIIIGFYDFKGGFGISFSGSLENVEAQIDEAEVSNLRWMTKLEILSCELRPGVRESIEDYFSGKQYPLSLITKVK